MPVTALNHYLIVSKNLERSKKFYQEVLGLDVAERPDFGFPGYWLKTGDHIAFLAQNPEEVRNRIQKNKVEMHFRSFPDAKLFQIFLKDPDDVTIELNFLGEVIDEKQWKGKGSASAVTLDGGKAVFIRHAITTPGVGDPPGLKLDDCATQRNLTDEGRGHAKRIGQAFKARNIPVERVLSSPWCRCI